MSLVSLLSPAATQANMLAIEKEITALLKDPQTGTTLAAIKFLKRLRVQLQHRFDEQKATLKLYKKI